MLLHLLAVQAALVATLYGRAKPRSGLHYEIGTTYHFEYELNVTSQSFRVADGSTGQSEWITCGCDITVDLEFDENSWLLQLSMYQMELTDVEPMGNRRQPQVVHDDEELSRHPFFVVQRKQGAIDRVFYDHGFELNRDLLFKLAPIVPAAGHPVGPPPNIGPPPNNPGPDPSDP